MTETRKDLEKFADMLSTAKADNTSALTYAFISGMEIGAKTAETEKEGA